MRHPLLASTALSVTLALAAPTAGFAQQAGAESGEAAGQMLDLPDGSPMV